MIKDKIIEMDNSKNYYILEDTIYNKKIFNCNRV